MRLFLAAQLYQVAGLSNSSTRTQNHFRFVWNCITNWKSGFLKIMIQDLKILLIHISKTVFWIKRGSTIMIKSRGNEPNHKTFWLEPKYVLVKDIWLLTYRMWHTVYHERLALTVASFLPFQRPKRFSASPARRLSQMFKQPPRVRLKFKDGPLTKKKIFEKFFHRKFDRKWVENSYFWLGDRRHMSQDNILRLSAFVIHQSFTLKRGFAF